VSSNGYPPLGFWMHDGATVPPDMVKSILVKGVGLSEAKALDLT